jgi:hypothetical protein
MVEGTFKTLHEVFIYSKGTRNTPALPWREGIYYAVAAHNIFSNLWFLFRFLL